MKWGNSVNKIPPPQWTASTQWRGESEAAGEAARLMAPPKSYFFAYWSAKACHVVGTTCNDRRPLRNTFGWMRVLQAPRQFHGRVLVEVQGARPLKAPKNLHFRAWLNYNAMFYKTLTEKK